MRKLRTKVTLLVCAVVAAILLLNHYPVSMSLRQTVLEANASALLDITCQFAQSPILAEGLLPGRKEEIQALAHQAQTAVNCTGLAILDRDGQVFYNSASYGIEPSVLLQYRNAPLAAKRYDIPNPNMEHTAIYAVCPIYARDGVAIGRVVSTLYHREAPAGLQKTRRDFKAMTILVMLIALIFVWDLTDNMKGTMFHLEPVEIAQLLVERNALIDAVRDGILSADKDGAILHANSTARTLCRHAMPGFDVNTGNVSALFPHLPLQEFLEEDKPLHDNECLVGTDSFYVSFIPIRIEKPKHDSLLITFRPKREVVRFAEDITGVKSYIEALRAHMHEFNNKLQVVSGLVQDQKYAELGDYVYALVHLKNREMQQITQRISDPVLAAFLMSKFDRASEQRVDLILTDRSALGRPLPQSVVQDVVVVVGNLLENAFDAVQGCDMQTVTLELLESSRELRISVWDSGAGIPEHLGDTLFDYGVTGKRNGHGIGLFLVRQACSRHSGYVTVVSTPQDGTELTAHIPLSREEEDDDDSSAGC